MRQVKVGLISFAHPHAFSYLQALLKLNDVALTGIAEPVKSRVESYCKSYRIPYYADYKELLGSDVDVVIISSENTRHAEMTIEAARHKKHVLCEKPLGLSKAEMDNMISACRENNVQLMTSFPNRYIPMIVQAKEAVGRGDIGDVIAVKATNKGEMPGDWFINRQLSGGGALLDHTVHVADLLNWILKAKPVEVFAKSGTLFHNIQVEDAGMVHIKYDNGVVAALDTSWSRVHAYPYKRDLTMTIIGTKGTIALDYFGQINQVYSATQKYAEWSYWGDNKDELLIRDFIDCIREGKEVAITGEDGMASALVALAALESASTGLPVRMD